MPQIQLEKIKVKRIFGEKGKNTKQNGIAWWYNLRLVGTPNWHSIDSHIIDGRHPIAKRLLYIIYIIIATVYYIIP